VIRLFWMRHGESTWNVAGREQGRTAHPPLTELGRAQVAAAADDLALWGVTGIVCSPLVRARESADLVGARLGLDVVEDPLRVERGHDETVDDVLDRIRRFLAGPPADSTLVVSHGDLIAYAHALLTRTEPRLPANAEVRVTVS
jgi:broad specificity phosphatase PhoE